MDHTAPLTSSTGATRGINLDRLYMHTLTFTQWDEWNLFLTNDFDDTINDSLVLGCLTTSSWQLFVLLSNWVWLFLIDFLTYLLLSSWDFRLATGICISDDEKEICLLSVFNCLIVILFDRNDLLLELVVVVLMNGVNEYIESIAVLLFFVVVAFNSILSRLVQFEKSFNQKS